MRRIFYQGITFKLIGAIFCATFGIGSLILYYNNRVTRAMIDIHARENAHLVTQAAILRIQSQLSKIESATNAIALYLEGSDRDKDSIKEYLKHLVASEPEIFGSAVALEPSRNQGREFAPYFHKQGKVIQYKNLADEDYRYLTQEWYLKAQTAGGAHWSKPYFDTGGGDILMSTYSVPIFRQIKGERRFIGVVTADISIDWLEKIVTPLAVFKNGYGFLVADDGTYISHPFKDRIMRQTIFQIADDEHDLKNMARAMTSGEEGFITHVSTFTNQPSFVYFMPFGRDGWSIGITGAKDELYADVINLNRTNLLITFLGFGILLIIIVGIAFSIIKPLRNLSQVAQELAGGNFDVGILHLDSRDEVGDLVSAFVTMREKLKDHIRNLMVATASKERIDSELNIARTIQLESLPAVATVLPYVGREFDLYAVMEPAEKVGGDFYDFFMCDDDHLHFVLGDVSGKGISAALFMVTTRIWLKTLALQYEDPAAVLTHFNTKICSENNACMFVTLIVGILDIRSGELRLANGGHDAPLTCLPSGLTLPLEMQRGPACGINPSAHYDSTHMTLLPNTTLLLFTDGVTEAQNEQKEFFTTQRLIDTLKRQQALKPQALVEQVLNALKSFSKTAPQTDDIAMLALRYPYEDLK